MKIRTIRSLRNEVRGAIALVRVDYNEPLKISKTKKTRLGEDFRIVSSLPTLRYLSRYGCKTVLMAHLGDDPNSDSATKACYSTSILAKRLEQLIGKKVLWTGDCLGDKVKSAIASMKDGEILMLENLRYYPEEKKNDEDFAKKLSELADVSKPVKQSGKNRKNISSFYVNEAFSVSHREHASVSAIKKFLPSYAGLLLEKEITNLNKAVKPKKPAVAIMGGAKISTKIKLINKLKSSYDYILIGGAMANNFFKAHGLEVGKSLVSEEDIALAKKLKGDNLILPQDVIVASREKGKQKIALRQTSSVLPEDSIYDIGPETIKAYSKLLRKAATIIWNGPLGKFEEPKFKHGTLSIASLVSGLSSGKAFVVAGGGETIEALRMDKGADNIDWVSTGGGAMLAYLGGEKMPGLFGLFDK